MDATDYGAVVEALRSVPGVAEAAVEPDGEGGMGLLRLGLDPDVDEVDVATRVGRVLREQFGLGVDADRVQIVEDADLARTTGGSAPDGALRARPSITRMHLVSSGLEVTATVTLTTPLSDGARVHSGEATGAASQAGVHRAVAQATLRAVEPLLDGTARFELDHLDITTVGAERTVVVSVTMVSSRGAERLTGAAAVREDVRQAVIRATLDALNRRLETLLGVRPA